MIVHPTSEQVADQNEIWQKAGAAYHPKSNKEQSVGEVIQILRKPLTKSEADQKIAQNVEKRLSDGRREVHRKQIITYEDARGYVANIAAELAKKRGKKLFIEDCQKLIWQNTIKYFIGDTDSEYNTAQGLFIWGDTGVGKTFLLEVMSVFCRELKLQNHYFQHQTSKRIADEVRAEKSLNTTLAYQKGNWFFDDVGREDVSVKILHGDTVDPISKLLDEREMVWKDRSFLTHMTSNLLANSEEDDPYKGLFRRFDEPLAWRIIEMSNFIYFPGENRRNPFSKINAGTKPAIF